MTNSNSYSSKARGLFLNPAEAQCSIYESGRMSYDCLRLSDRYQLDYQEIDPTCTQIGVYDFYVFNYHHVTMAWLNTDSIRKLPGKKFTLVLETLPGDPFVLCPVDVFDAYLTLDPTMDRPGDPRVYAFPRPLESPPFLPPFREPDIPIIGTFGFATPGKGFERVVEAVNREFKRAIVRINIPSSTYADDTFYGLHRTNYASYLADLCRRVAKPGIHIQVSNNYLSKEQLISWCAGNSLNCFLYHRDQPGLSATTDQAIASGRPLAISTNETFRHIHTYVKPYPFQTLRQSLENSTSSVLQMQHDWAPQVFARKFEGVLADFFLLPSSGISMQGPLKVDDRLPLKRKVLVVSHKESQCGIHQYGLNIFSALNKSSCYTFEHTLCASHEELHYAILTAAPAVVIYNYYPATMPWLTPMITRRYNMPCLGIMHEVTQEEADRATTEMFDFHLCPDPTIVQRNPCVIRTKRLIPHYLNMLPEPLTPTIGSFGFGFGDKGFERLIRLVQNEFDNAVIRLHLPFNDIVDQQGKQHALATAERCRNSVTKKGIRLEISHHFMVKKDLLRFLGENTINAFFYDIHKHRGISSVIEYALAVERPIAITRCGMFRHVLNATPSICIEDNSLQQIIANGIAPLVPFYNEWSEANFIKDYEQILNRVFGTQHKSQPTIFKVSDCNGVAKTDGQSQPPNEIEFKLAGYTVLLNSAESIQRGISLGVFEPDETKWLYEILKPGMTFIDVGANIGYFSLIASSIVGESGSVYSFDPSLYAYNKICQSIKINGINNIKAYNVGLGDISEERELLRQDDDTHSPSFIPTTGIKIGISKIQTLDSFAENNGIDFIDFIKIDVEGYEPNVIRGMISLLLKNKVHRIMIELYDDWLVQNNSSSEKMDSAIRSFGFTLEKHLMYQKHGNYVYVSKLASAYKKFHDIQRIKFDETNKLLKANQNQLETVNSKNSAEMQGGYNRILDSQARLYFQTAISRLFALVPDMMARKIPEANVQQAFVLSSVEKFAESMNMPKILCVGSYDDTAAAALKALGYQMDEIDPTLNYDLNTFFNLPTTRKGYYDIIFSTSVIEHVEDDELFVRQIAELLAHDGVAIITCDYNDQYKSGDHIPQEDFRLYTKHDLMGRLLLCMQHCSLVDSPAWECADPDFVYAGCRYTFATFVVRKHISKYYTIPSVVKENIDEPWL